MSLKMGDAGEAPKGESQSCFPRTYFAKSEQLCPKLPQCFSLSANQSSPEASPAPSPTCGHPAAAPWGISPSAKLSRFAPFLTARRHQRSSQEGPRTFSYCCFIYVLGQSVAGLTLGREGAAAGGQGQPGSRWSRWRGLLLTLALLWDVTVREGRGGEAAAIKHLTGHLVVRPGSSPWLGE